MIPTIDYNKFGVQMLPRNKRKPKFIAWIKGILSQHKRTYDNFYGFYNGFSSSSLWSNIAIYNLDSVVIYKLNVYKSLIDNNTAYNPETNTDKWEKLCDSIIGLQTSANFSSKRIVLEYALNAYFIKYITAHSFTGFVQPDDPVNPTRSTIYIDNVYPSNISFISYEGEINSSISYSDTSSEYVYSNITLAGVTSYLFTVNIPTSVFSDINADPLIAESIVRRFLDTYVAVGIEYTITTY